MASIEKQKDRQSFRTSIKGYLLVAPAIILLCIFTVYPIFYLIHASMLKGSIISAKKKFVGLDNYKYLFSSPDFGKVVINTVLYSFILVAVVMVLAVLVAVWINSNKNSKINQLTQAAIFTPHITSLVAVSMVFMWLMDPQIGFINSILTSIGLPRFSFLASPKTALISLVLVMVWKTTGYFTLLILAALNTIPKSIYEAAELDDTPKYRVLLRITIPMISPTLFFTTIIATIGSFRVFETVNLMTQGGPVNSTNTLVYYIYEYAFKYAKLGRASAAGVVLLLFVGILTFVYFKCLSKKVHYK
ncbi:MAG: sugar ABC transporter permease [Vallitalea sp.]|jgi:sn-glycerol 3-phosphate transport system permease protein|nr:sugar ABC transporter permease [Vallitalea sp.]